MYYIKPALLAVCVIALIMGLARAATQELRDVQSGKSELWCHLHTGFQKIEPDMVEGLHSNGNWLFRNGSARSCEVVKK